jgi:hypothetical protein
MEALTLALAGLILMSLLGALAMAFGTDSRDGMDDTRLDAPRPFVGSAR